MTDEAPRTVGVQWESCYRITLPFRAGIDDPLESEQISALIRYCDPVSRMKQGSLPQHYGMSGSVHTTDPVVLSPFTTISPSLFSDGGFGVCYVARDEEVAIREMADRLTPILMVAGQHHAEIEFVVIEMSLQGQFHDFYYGDNQYLMDPEYDMQNFGRQLRAESSRGILFRNRSGFDPDSPCVAVFDSSCLKVRSKDSRIILIWHEGRFVGYYRKSPPIYFEDAFEDDPYDF